MVEELEEDRSTNNCSVWQSGSLTVLDLTQDHGIKVIERVEDRREYLHRACPFPKV